MHKNGPSLSMIRLRARSLFIDLARPWTSPRQRRRLLTIAGAVAFVITGAHHLAPAADPRIWTLLHALVPATVFALGLWTSGVRWPSSRDLWRGFAVVLLVFLAFSWINRRAIPLAPAFGLNLLVPLIVSTVAAAAPLTAGRRADTP